MKYVTGTLIGLIVLTVIAIGLLQSGVIDPQVNQSGAETESESETLETEAEETTDESPTEIDTGVEGSVEPTSKEETRTSQEQHMPENTPVDTEARQVNEEENATLGTAQLSVEKGIDGNPLKVAITCSVPENENFYAFTVNTGSSSMFRTRNRFANSELSSETFTETYSAVGEYVVECIPHYYGEGNSASFTGTEAVTRIIVGDYGGLTGESFEFSFGPQEITPDTMVSTSCRLEGNVSNIRKVGIYIRDASHSRSTIISTDNKEEMQSGISFEGTLAEDKFSFFGAENETVQVEAYCLAFTEGWDMIFSIFTPITLRP